MADNDVIDDLNDEQDETPRGLRAAAGKAKRLESENEALKRQLAFARAGIAGDDDRTRIFINGYDGDLDPARIREVAESTGFLQAPAAPTEDPNADSAKAQQQFAQVTAPSAAAPATPTGEAALVDAFQQGGVEALTNAVRAAGVPVQYDGQ